MDLASAVCVVAWCVFVVAACSGATGETAWAAIGAAALAAVAAVFAWSAAPKDSPGRRGLAWGMLVVGCAPAAITLLALLLLPSMGRAREPANRVKCASNLRQIGQAIQMYANGHGGRFPPTLGTLLLTEDITSEVFVCPSSNDERAEGPATQAVIRVDSDPLYCSYVYAGAGLNAGAVTRGHVLVYDRTMGHHNGDGMNVLYGDFSVSWLDPKAAEHVIAELKAGQNPPRAKGAGGM